MPTRRTICLNSRSGLVHAYSGGIRRDDREIWGVRDDYDEVYLDFDMFSKIENVLKTTDGQPKAKRPGARGIMIHAVD